jgi:malonate transporter MadL subunit
MIIFGTALLAGCYLLGAFLGQILGIVIHAQANVGGVGIAMILLITAQYFLKKRNLLPPETEKGITFWAMMYIPVVVAMASTQNVRVAVVSGPLAIFAALGSVILCVLVISFINRIILRKNGDAPWNPDTTQTHK